MRVSTNSNKPSRDTDVKYISWEQWKIVSVVVDDKFRVKLNQLCFQDASLQVLTNSNKPSKGTDIKHINWDQWRKVELKLVRCRWQI